jgi:hypothetical protein
MWDAVGERLTDTLREEAVMIRTLRFAAVFVPALILLIAVQGLARGQSPPAKLYVAPNVAAPGGEIVLSGHGFTPGALPNFVASGEFDEYDLGPASADADGQFHIAATLPAGMVPDTYTVFTFEAADPVTTTLTVAPSPTITLNPTLGPPGTLVTFTVSPLITGHLQLDYAGAAVFGPAPIGGGVFTGTFSVPGDRPTPLGSIAAVTATNFVAGKIFGRGYTIFESMPAGPPPTYSFANVQVSVPVTRAGNPFTVTGQVVLPPGGLPPQSKLKMLWKAASGKTFPINPISLTLQSSGNFQIIGLLPTLYNGDPAPASSGDQFSLSLYSQNEVVLVGSFFGMPIGSPPAFRIRVVNALGQPIQGAMVSMRGLGLPSGSGGVVSDSDQGNVPVGNLTLNSPNQVLTFFEPVLPPGQNPFACPPTDAYGPTDADGYFQPNLNWDLIRGWLGSKIPMQVGPKTVYQQIPVTATFTIYANALWQGYGTLDSSSHPQVYTRTLVYSNNTNKFYNWGSSTPLQTNPITITLPALPPGAQPEVPIVPTVDAPQKDTFNWFGTVMPVYGKLYSFSDLADNPNVAFQQATLRIDLNHDPLQSGLLDEVRLYLDNVDKGAFSSSASGDCAGATSYTFFLPNAHRLTPGWHFLRVEARPTGVITPTQRTLILDYGKPPAAAKWIYDASYKSRKVTWYPEFVDLSGAQLPSGDPGSSSVLAATVPKVGYLENKAGADNFLWQRIDAAGNVKTNYIGGIQTKALNSTAKDPEAGKSHNVVANNPIKIGSPNPITILDTGWMPLFRDHWGIWPIASATIGADMAFKATLTYNGTISFSPPSSTLLVNPAATVAVDAWFNLSAIFGLVEANAHAIPAITVNLPVSFTNGNKSDSDVCFRYRLDIKWYAKVGECPLCDEESGTKNIFNDYTPKSPLCASTATKVASTSAAAPPPSTNPSLASDGFGHTLAVWSDDNNDLKYSALNGATWSAPQTLSANHKSLRPRVAFFAPNQALAVWAQSGLSAPANFTDTVKAQRLAYAVWNGSAWSAPQNLTAPTTGEGSVALAACPSTTSGCPASGAVTAVWIRDVAGDLAQRRFRLFHATYQGGAWGSIQAVDAASAATDSEPSLVYQGNQPLVVWVRDADRDLGTLADRRLAYRLLDGVSPVVVPGDLPAGIVEPSAAIDPSGNLKIAFTLAEDADAFTGNQRTLHSAAQSCTPTCAWSVQKLQDNHARALRGESPILTLDKNGKGTITFRGLGFGPLPNGQYQAFPEDAIGMLTLTGEAAQVDVDFVTAVHSPHYLSNDGAVNWHPAAVYDSALNQIQTIVVKGAAPALSQALKAQHSAAVSLRATSAAQAAGEVTFASVPLQPDFVVAALTPSNRYPPPGDPFSAEVQLRNDGVTWQAGRTEQMSLAASWDGEPGVGALIGTTEITQVLSGQIVTLTLTFPPLSDPDVAHRLFVTVNPTRTVAERTAINNSLSALIGGMPVVTDVVALAQTGNSLVYLQWTPLSERRVAGYRVYRSEDGGPFAPVGSSFVGGFVDLNASLDHVYHYAVATFNVDGVESELSSALEVGVSSFRVYLPLALKGR